MGTRAFERITGSDLFREEEGEGRKEGRKGVKLDQPSEQLRARGKEVWKAMSPVRAYVTVCVWTKSS